MPIAVANIKRSPNPSQVNIKPDTKGIFTSVPITWYTLSGFQQQQKITRHAKKKTRKNTIQRDIASIRIRLRYDTHVGISDRDFKITMINM